MAIVVAEEVASRLWVANEGMVHVFGSPNLSSIRVPDIEPFVYDEDGTAPSDDAPAQVYSDDATVTMRLSESLGVSRHDAEAEKRGHMVLVNYLVVGVLVPVPWLSPPSRARVR